VAAGADVLAVPPIDRIIESTLVTLAIAQPETAPAPMLLRNVSWRFYESFLSEVASTQRLYLTYDRGNLEIMPPSPFHERYKTILARFVEQLTLELDIPIVSGGSTTFRREDLKRGLEPDECYYVQHEADVRETQEVDLTRDPPPDLVIEMDYTRHVIDRLGVYAALGVPEVWRYDLRRLEVLHLNAEGKYVPGATSLAFPFLPMVEVERFLLRRTTTAETPLVRQFRDWVREKLAKP
jgi:Uma2 family endonuclease